MGEVAVIVDAFSTGAQLAPKFRAYGMRSVHIQSSRSLPELYTSSFRFDDFLGHMEYSGSLLECVAQVEAWCEGVPTCVMAGAETGIELADRLAHHWGLPGNPVGSSACRRDKFEMAAALTRANLAAATSLRCSDLQALHRWAIEQNSWPIVLKPLASAGSDSVYFCAHADDLTRAFHAIVGKVNRLGGRNDEVLAQTYLRGTQYVVNSVSADGEHYFSDIWIDRRKILAGASNLYDYEELLPARGPVQDVLVAYMRRALDALGIRNGPAHSEVMLTAAGPVLIETGARLQGSMLEQPMLDALGASQISLSVERYCLPDVFKQRLQQPYRLASHVMCVALISGQAGVVEDVSGLERIRALDSYLCDLRTPRPGERIEITTDLYSIPGVIYLGHPDADVVHRDYETLRRLERDHEIFALRTAVDA